MEATGKVFQHESVSDKAREAYKLIIEKEVANRLDSMMAVARVEQEELNKVEQELCNIKLSLSELLEERDSMWKSPRSTNVVNNECDAKRLELEDALEKRQIALQAFNDRHHFEEGANIIKDQLVGAFESMDVITGNRLLQKFLDQGAELVKEWENASSITYHPYEPSKPSYKLVESPDSHPKFHDAFKF